MIPNGVELPSLSASDGERAGVRCAENSVTQPSTRNPQPPLRTALFLGRIHPIKGLLDLIKAWVLVRPQGWRVAMAGGDENNHRAEVEAAIQALDLAADFSFLGPVAGDAKWSLYQQADLFVLPSHSENFGIVVAEALASSVPVITTRGTPWEDLVTHRCGWWTDNGPEPLAAALRDALNRTDEERHEMGRRGRQLVEQKYSWPGIAAQMHAVYRWVLGEGEKPECVAEQ
jgi:glycosyltransferase involved in cell wall biosynthesis